MIALAGTDTLDDPAYAELAGALAGGDETLAAYEKLERLASPLRAVAVRIEAALR